MSDGFGPVRFRTPALLGALRDLVSIAIALEIGDPEARDGESVKQDLLPRVKRILDCVIGLLGQFLLAYEGASPQSPSQEAPEGSDEARIRLVADHCFISKMEMSHWRTNLDNLDSSAYSNLIIGNCNQALGAFVKAAIALESRACEVVAQPCQLGGLNSASASAELRRAFQAFHVAVSRGGDPAKGELRNRLEVAGDAVAVLLHSGIRTRIRLSDRCQLMLLETRLKEWIELGETADPSDGLHIWQNMNALAAMMMQINRREELVTHDLAILEELVRRFAETTVPGHAPLAWSVELKPLLGRDEELDRIIENPRSTSAETFEKLLMRLVEDLRGRPVPSDEARQPALR